ENKGQVRDLSHIFHNSEISEVLISGGDPLTLSDKQLDELLRRIRSVKTVKVIRIATRALVAFPSRVCSHLVATLRLHAPVYVCTHFNHPREITAKSIAAANKLTDAGIPVVNQTVLLRGVNDNAEVIAELCRTLHHNRIRPYYLFQCDLVRGVEHFRTPLQTGLDIMRHLRGTLSGLAIPHFAIDTPRHGGKIELLPQCVVRETPDGAILINGKGEEFFHPNPQQP
ncbi:MAG: arginine 2,3-aminomutase, partial [Kiritimatiellaeota bacterium]|nr:arginine 2,3-aminomutase [Kiritimatiellota bacterium]